MRKVYLYLTLTILSTQLIFSCKQNAESKDKAESIKYETYCGYCGQGILLGQIVQFYDNKSFCNDNCCTMYRLKQ